MHNALTKRLTQVVFFVGACLLSVLLWLVAHIPSADDVAVADQVGKAMAQHYGHFPARDQVEKQGHGQIYYSHPGAFAHPQVDLYEVTVPQEITQVEAAARQALGEVHAKAVTLRFFEKENLTLFASGGRGHGPEHLLKTEVIRTDAS